MATPKRVAKKRSSTFAQRREGGYFVKKLGKKASVALAVGMGMTVLVSGCGTSNNTSNTSNAAGNSATTSSTSTTTAAPVKVTFWEGMSGQLGGVLQHLVTKFNATHKGVHVDAIYEGSYADPSSTLQQKLLAAIASGKVPDMVQVEVHSLPTYAANGAFENLTSYMASSSHDQKSDFVPGILYNTTYNNVVYGLPFNRSVQTFYYNPKMFQEAGISGPPKTWADVEKDAAIIHAKLSKPGHEVFGFEPAGGWWTFEQNVLSAGGTLMNSSMTKATFDTPQAAAALQIMAKMEKQGTMTCHSSANGWDETIADFGDGRTAMYCGSAADMGQIRETKLAFKAAPMPYVTQPVVTSGGADMAIMSQAPAAAKKAAWEFMEWMTAPAQTEYWSMNTGYMPVLQSAITSSTMQTYYQQHPNAYVPVQELKYAEQAPPTPLYLELQHYEQNAVDDVLVKHESVMQALKTNVQKANQAISQ